MKILMVNKFLYPCGGSETYMFKLGEQLTAQGHMVQYFGMEDKRNIVGNNAGCYTKAIDFRSSSISYAEKFTYLFRIIYSHEARIKIKKIIDDFHPDIVHLNNINFEITPSIIYEIKKNNIPIVWTVHDAQLVCPNHRLFIEQKKQVCSLCIHGNYINCVKNKCIQNSAIKSMLAMLESVYYHTRKTYQAVDLYICPSRFMKNTIQRVDLTNANISVMHNFSNYIDLSAYHHTSDKYILYFGRLSTEKGIETLIKVCKQLSDIQFIFAGTGELKEKLCNISNIKYVGFQMGDMLNQLIYNATATIYPSEWYENCPLSIIESQNLGTPVLASNIGGIPELIEDGKTGLLFEAGNTEAIADAVKQIYYDDYLQETIHKNCISCNKNTVDLYTKKLISMYKSLLKQKLI